MRPIIYRAKKVEDGKWIYGGVSVFKGEFCVFDSNSIDNGCYEVEEESICQFTGLKDSKKTPIYENDIVLYTEHPGYLLKTQKLTIVWIDELACFGFIQDLGQIEIPVPFSECDELNEDILNYCEVIGNTID